MSRGKTLGGGSTVVMGILNVTPDSFSDGGRWFSTTKAVDHGLEMIEAGATLVDVGGESTRPGAVRVPPDVEWQRVGPVISELVDAGVSVSVDTVNASTARLAIEAGVDLVNDVSGGRNDPEIVRCCARAGCAFVVQHWRGFPAAPLLNSQYQDVVEDVATELALQVRETMDLGLDPKALVIDPGLGFAKDAADSWRLVESIETFTDTGIPVLVGASRKRFVRARHADALVGTIDVTRACAASGVWAVRVHDVAPNVLALEADGLGGTARGI